MSHAAQQAVHTAPDAASRLRRPVHPLGLPRVAGGSVSRSLPTPQGGNGSALAAQASAILQRGAMALFAVLPADGVLFSAMWRKRGGWPPVRVEWRWPGKLVEVAPNNRAVLAKTNVAAMHAQRPGAAAFITPKVGGKLLLTAAFQSPNSAWLQASIDAFGVVRVHGIKSGALLAQSEAGKPMILCSGFNLLTHAASALCTE